MDKNELLNCKDKVLDCVIEALNDFFEKGYSLTTDETFDYSNHEAAVFERIFNCTIHRNDFYSAHGCTKFVLLNKNLPYVIKLPFSGRKVYDKYDEEIIYYENSGSINDSSDYCAREVEIYQEMKDLGLEMFFAKIEDTGRHSYGVEIYTQEKVRVATTGFCPTVSKKAMEASKEHCYSCGECSPDDTWIAAAIDYYGEDAVEALFDYLNEWEPDWAGDFHAANYGYREDGSPCFLDYCGFNEDY